MGFFSRLFGKKVNEATKGADDILAEAEAAEAVEAELEEIEVKDLQSERSYINRVQLAYDNKSKLLRAAKAYTSASRGVLSTLKQLNHARSQLWLTFKNLHKFALAGAVQEGKKWLEKQSGKKWDNQWQVEKDVEGIMQQIQLADKKIAVELAQDSPKLANAKKTEDVLKGQLALLSGYMSLVQRELINQKKIIIAINKEIAALEKERDALKKENPKQAEFDFGKGAA